MNWLPGSARLPQCGQARSLGFAVPGPSARLGEPTCQPADERSGSPGQSGPLISQASFPTASAAGKPDPGSSGAAAGATTHQASPLGGHTNSPAATWQT